jgi:hypothetical protein
LPQAFSTYYFVSIILCNKTYSVILIIIASLTENNRLAYLTENLNRIFQEKKWNKKEENVRLAEHANFKYFIILYTLGYKPVAQHYLWNTRTQKKIILYISIYLPMLNNKRPLMLSSNITLIKNICYVQTNIPLLENIEIFCMFSFYFGFSLGKYTGLRFENIHYHPDSYVLIISYAFSLLVYFNKLKWINKMNIKQEMSNDTYARFLALDSHFWLFCYRNLP